jgi:aldose 1-epimerase
MSTDFIELNKAQWRLSVNPALGGSVMGLWHGDQAVLRPASKGATHAAQCSAFPLVPYSNRIGHGHMRWEGVDYVVRNGFDEEAHGLHGVGFMRPWQVVERNAESVRLRLVHTPDTFWPFAFEAEQHFQLQNDGLSYTITARNIDTRSQPMGLGWHPYFVRQANSELKLPVHTQWLSGEDLLPKAAQAMEGLAGLVNGMQLDHCFEGADCTAQFDGDGQRLTLDADSRYWVVYTPTDADFYCVEPVTHLNNAVQQPDPQTHGLVALGAGEAMRLGARLHRSTQSKG